MMEATIRKSTSSIKQQSHKVCSHGLCKNSGRTDHGADLRFIQFPQACIIYRNEQIEHVLGREINSTRKHIPGNCMQCCKALRWLNLCKREDFKYLFQVNKNRYICSKHFVDGSGPTPDHPDPLPANISENTASIIRKRARKPPTPRTLTLNQGLTRAKKPKMTQDGDANITATGDVNMYVKNSSEADIFNQGFDEENTSDTRVISNPIAVDVCSTENSPDALFNNQGINATHNGHAVNIHTTVTDIDLSINKPHEGMLCEEKVSEKQDQYVIIDLSDVDVSVGNLPEGSTCKGKESDNRQGGEMHESFDAIQVGLPPKNLPEEITNAHTAGNEKFAGFKNYLYSLLNSPWAVQLNSNGFRLFQPSSKVCMNAIEAHITCEDLFLCSLYVYGQPIPMDSEVYIKCKNVHSLQSLDELLTELNVWNLCSGIENNFTSSLLLHEKGYVCQFTDKIHSKKCKLLCGTVRCFECTKYSYLLNARAAAERKKQNANVHRSCNNRFLTREQLIHKLNVFKKNHYTSRLKEKKLKTRYQQLLNDSGICVGKNENKDLRNILLKTEQCYEVGDFRKIFINEQLKASQRKSCNGYVWHPKMVQFALYMHHKSPGAYKALRNVLLLPSQRKLHDFSKHMNSKPGFVQHSIPQEVLKLAKQSNTATSKHQGYFSIIFDEIKLSEGLVYSQHSGQLLGFVHLNESENALGQLAYEKDNEIRQKSVATHMMQFMVKGITNGASFLFSCFPTNGLTATELYSLICEAIERLEFESIKILAIICDGHAVNRTFMKMASPDKHNPYYMDNPYSLDEHRQIYFISDQVHLIKTVRNSFSNSRLPANGKPVKRLMWKNGQYITWKAIQDVYLWDLRNNPRVLPKLTDCHVHLNAQSQMRVKYAVQVLSNSTAAVVEHYWGPSASETVKFIRTFNKLFDIMNVRHVHEGKHKRNLDLEPFTRPEDKRLLWLESEFLSYLTEWETEVRNRPGNFSANDREKMLLAKPTLEGLNITVKSVPAVIRFLLGKGAKFVLSGKLNQDTLEQVFAQQRALGGTHSNPDCQRYLQNLRKLQILKEFAITGANTNTEQQ